MISSSIKSMPIILIATQRSGTNYFRKILESTKQFKNCLEVFNGDVVEAPRAKHHYYNFLIKKINSNPKFIIPNLANQKELFLAYLDYLSELWSDYPFHILDIKYNSLNTLDGVWRNSYDPPNVITLIKDLELPLIHLKRENLFNVYISRKVAENTKIYILSQNDSLELPKLNINPEDAVKTIRILEEEERVISSLLSSVPRKIALTYEELIKEKDCLPGSVHKDLENLLNTQIEKKVTCPIKKIVTSQSSVISNFLEVSSYLEMNGLGHYIE